MRVGLVGGKLGHSFSKPIHEKLADYTYDLIQVRSMRSIRLSIGMENYMQRTLILRD